MKWLVLAIVIISQQPAEAPKGKGSAESDRAKSAAHANNTEDNQTPSTHSAPAPTQPPVAIESQRSATAANNHTQASSQQTADENRSTQRKLTWFTGVLAVVGVLQLIVMFLTWWVYRRQAGEMRRQRHEMKQQRHIMWRQWKATGEQLGQMENAGRQTDELIKHAEAQAKELHESSTAANKSANAVINTERAWIVPELRPHAYQGKHGRWFDQDNIPLGTDEVLAGRHLIYSLKLTNMGRTPAQIVGWELRYTCLPDGVSDLPENAPGDFVSSHEFYHLLAGNGASVLISEPTLDAGELMFESLDAIRQLRKTAVFHGHVRYRHMFSAKDDAYADFCYVFTVSLNRLSSVGRYTRQR